jgi:hypothetical protein
MHTKDKSKYAAALIVKPSKTVEQLLKDRSNDDTMNDSSLDDFIDAEDSMQDSDFTLKECLPGADDVCLKVSQEEVNALILTPALYEDEDAPGVRHNTLASIADTFSHISLFSFQSIMRSVVLKVSEFIASDATVPPNIKDDISIKILRSLAKGPFKKLLTPYFLRILTVHIGFRCKLAISSFLFKHGISSLNNLMDNVPLMQDLLCVVSSMEETYINRIIFILGDVLTISTMRYITDRFKVTIARYAILPGICVNESDVTELNYAAAMTSLMTTLLSNLLNHDRFAPVTNVSRKILAYILPTVGKVDNHILQTTWIDVLQRKAADICCAHPVTTDNSYDSCESKDEKVGVAVANASLPAVEGAQVLHSLVQLLEKGRSISRLEFFDSKLCYMATEMAFVSFFASLPHQSKVSISRYMATSLNTLLDTRKSKLHPIRVLAKYKEELLDLIKVLLTEETASDFCVFYQILLSKRLLKSRYSSLSSETLMLDELPAMSNARYMIQEVEATSRYMQQFRKYLIHKIDNNIIHYDALPADNIYQVILQQGAIEVAVLSGTNVWPSQILSPNAFSSLILPRELATVASEFKAFFESDQFDLSANEPVSTVDSAVKRKLIWCHGLGTVTFTCRLNDNSVAYLVGSEPQFTVLMAFNDRNRRVSPPRRASPGSSKYSFTKPHSQCVTIDSLMRACGLSYDETLSVVASLTSPEMQVLEVTNKSEDDDDQLGVNTQLMLSDTLLNGSLGGDDSFNPIVLPRYASNPSTSFLLKSMGNQWHMSVIESCITKKLKEISRQNNGTFVSVDGSIETTAISLQDLHEHIASCQNTVTSSVSLTDVRRCCHRLVEVGIIEQVEGSDKSFSSLGYSYLPLTRSNYPANLPCATNVSKFAFGMDYLQVDELYRKKVSNVFNYSEDVTLLYTTLADLVAKDARVAGIRYESFMSNIPLFVASLKFTPLEVLVNYRASNMQSSLIFNADGFDCDEALECDRRGGLISPININISSNAYYANSNLYDIILDITNRCFGSSLLGGYKAFSTWQFHHEYALSNRAQSADGMLASIDVVNKVLQSLSSKRVCVRDTFSVIKVVFQQMPTEMILSLLALFHALTNSRNMYSAEEGVELIHEKLDECWTSKYDLLHASETNDIIALLFNQDCTCISVEELLASVLKYGFLNYNLNGVINNESDGTPSRSARKRAAGKSPAAESSRLFPNINGEHKGETIESKDAAETVAEGSATVSYSELVNKFLKKIYDFISVKSLIHSQCVSCLELLEGLAVSMHESIQLIISKAAALMPQSESSKLSNDVVDARFFSNLQANKVATIIYDNVSTAGIEIDIWDSCSGVYDNDDVGFSGGSHDDDEKFEEGESGQLAVQNPTRSKRVGYQIFSATVKRLFTLFDAHTNDNVLTPADFVSSAIAQRCATAINEEMKSDQVHLGSAVTLHKYADEVTAIRNHFRAKCKSWDLLDESVMMTAWHHGDYNNLEDAFVLHIYSLVDHVNGVLPALRSESDHLVLSMLRYYKWDLDEFIDAYSVNSQYVKSLMNNYDESSNKLEIRGLATEYASYCGKLDSFKVDGEVKYSKHLRQYEGSRPCMHCAHSYHWPLSCAIINSWNGFVLCNRGSSTYYNNLLSGKHHDALGLSLPTPPLPLTAMSSPGGIDNLGNVLTKNSTPIGSIPSSPSVHAQTMAALGSPTSGGSSARSSKFHDLENRMGVINHMAQYLSHMETGAAALFKAKEYAALIAEARSSNILIKLRIISECWMLLSHAYIIIGYTHLYLEHNRSSHMNKLLHLLHTLSSAVYSLHNMALKILNNGSNDGSNITIAKFQLSIFGVRRRLYLTLDEWVQMLDRAQTVSAFGRSPGSFSRLINSKIHTER